MKFPIGFYLNDHFLNLHGIFEALAFFIGFQYFRYLRKKQADHITDNNRIWILIGATAGAFIGSRIVGAMEDPFLLVKNEHLMLAIVASKSIVGGLLGGLLGVELTKKIIGVTQSSGDLFTYPILLAMMIGRVGCFTMGIAEPTYGEPSDLPWAMDLGDGIPRHPLALYEIIFLGALWLGLRKLDEKKLLPGIRFQLFMIAYLVYRFCIDFIKPGLVFPFGLTTIQVTCLLGLLYYHRTLWQFIIHNKSLQENYAG